MNPDDRKLSLLAVATAVGGGYIVKLALDEMLGPVQPAYAREFEEAHARAFGLGQVEPDALSEAVAFSIAIGMTAWGISQASDWIVKQVGK